jgi:hypothetical protein
MNGNLAHDDEVPTFELLLGELVDLTRSQKVKWRETPDENVFICALKRGSVEIARRERWNEDSGEVTRLLEATLLNPQGRVAETVSSLGDDLNQESINSSLAELFEAARSQARKSEDLLQGLLEEVGDLRRH